MRTLFFALLALFLWPRPARAEQTQLSLRLWCELDPMVQDSEDYPLSDEEARRRILEEARFLLSGMIYGFDFLYTPADARRGIEEEFTLAPVAEVLWSDPNLRITDAYLQDAFLFVKIYYDLEDFQVARRRAWASTAITASTGVGTHSVFTDPAPVGKRRALEEAMKQAIRNALRPVHFNQPREITGELVIWEQPRTVIRSGAYTTELTLKLRVKELRPYSLF